MFYSSSFEIFLENDLLFFMSPNYLCFLKTWHLFFQELHTEPVDKDSGGFDRLMWSPDGSMITLSTRYGHLITYAVASDLESSITKEVCTTC